MTVRDTCGPCIRVRGILD